MQKTTKITLTIFFLLIIAVIPLYYYTHPDTNQPEGTLQIRGNVNNPINLTLAQMKTYQPVTVSVSLSSSGNPEENGVYNYTGITLQELLNQTEIRGEVKTIFIQASDGYGTTLTIQEAQKQNTVIAYQKDGLALSALKDGGEGPLRLIIGDDEYAQRWIRGVTIIEVN